MSPYRRWLFVNHPSQFLDRYEKGLKLSGVIYIHPITDRRFTEIAARNFNMFRELYGDSALENVVLVTNMWGAVPHDVGEARESELSSNYFKPVLDGGAQMVRYHNNTESAHDVVRRITVVDCPVVLRIQRELVDEHMDIVDTSAGEAFSRELNERLSEHGAELKKVWDDMMQAFMDKDEVARRDLEEEAKGLQELMERIKEDLEGMAENYAMEKERVEVTVEKMEQELEREGQRTEAELISLNRYLQDATSASMANQVKLEQEMRRRERIEAEYNRQLADLNHHLRDMAHASAADQARSEQEERERAGAEYKQQLADLTLRLQHTETASAADRARLEQVEAEHNRHLADLSHRLQEATNALTNDRAKLEQLLKERDRVDAERKQRLADLTRRLQDETSASAAHRVGLEQDTKELRGRVVTAVMVPPRVPPRSTPCVQIFLYSAAHDC